MFLQFLHVTTRIFIQSQSIDEFLLPPETATLKYRASFHITK